MREVDIPGGTALLKERADLTGDDEMILSAATAGASEVIELMRSVVPLEKAEDESDEDFEKRQADRRSELNLSMEENLRLMAIAKAGAFVSLHSWTLKAPPLPKTFEQFGKLPRDIFGALVGATGGEHILALLGGVDFEPIANGTREQEKEQATPTGGSASSEASSVSDRQSLPAAAVEISPTETSPSESALSTGESNSPEQ